MFEEYTVHSHLSEKEVWERLHKSIGQAGAIKEYVYGTTPYYGSIHEPIFTASRIDPLIFLRWSAGRKKPVVQGKITPKGQRCEITFTISPYNVEKGRLL